MYYYVIQVKTRSEEKFARLLKSVYSDNYFQIFSPKRTLPVRRRGLLTQSTSPVFPGYLFLQSEEIFPDNFHWRLKAFGEFFRLLKTGQHIKPLSGRSLQIVLHFIKKIGPLAGLSQVYFNDDSRIVVLSGPLAGLEGNIVKVDKRKKRAKIKLDIYKDSFLIDLGFELIEPSSKRITAA